MVVLSISSEKTLGEALGPWSVSFNPAGRWHLAWTDGHASQCSSELLLCAVEKKTWLNDDIIHQLALYVSHNLLGHMKVTSVKSETQTNLCSSSVVRRSPVWGWWGRAEAFGKKTERLNYLLLTLLFLCIFLCFTDIFPARHWTRVLRMLPWKPLPLPFGF